MDDVTIRPARAEDLPHLRQVYRDASLSNPGDAEALLAHPELLEFAGDGIAAGHTQVAVVTADGAERVVGFLTLVPTADGVLELDDLFVEPGCRRRGIARRLMDDATQRAGDRAIVVTGNTHALPFYQAVGFVRIGEAPTMLGPAPRLRRDPTHQ